MKPLYLETSALLRILFSQADSAEFVTRIKKAKRVVTSRLTRVEAERSLIRLALEDPEFEKRRADFERDLRSLWARVDLVEMDESICELAGRISPKSRLRSLDVIHLATFHALRARTPSIEMLSCDERILAELP